MQYSIDHSMEVLSSTPRVIRELVGGLCEPWLKSNIGPETFSPFDVVGHLLHGECNDWMLRLHIILAHGIAQPFESFDRYAMYETSAGKTIDELLNEFEMQRERNLEELRGLNLTNEQLKLPGMHPELGRVNARQLLAAWVVHDLHHIAQISHTMAFQYRDEVGAWEQYLGILKPR